MTNKYYYALKQQEKYNTVPLSNNIKPLKYWVCFGSCFYLANIYSNQKPLIVNDSGFFLLGHLVILNPYISIP